MARCGSLFEESTVVYWAQTFRKANLLSLWFLINFLHYRCFERQTSFQFLYHIIQLSPLWWTLQMPLVFDDMNEICVPNEGISVETYLYFVICGVISVTVPIITIATVAASFYYTKCYIILKKHSTIKPIIRFAIFVILNQCFTLLGSTGVIVTLNRSFYFVSFYVDTSFFVQCWCDSDA